MKFYILAVGNKMPDWIKAGYIEYIKRMPHEITVELVEIKPEKRIDGKQSEQLLYAESVRIRAAITPGCRLIILDERGKRWSTIKLADVISDWMSVGGDTAFIIGSADGLHDNIKNLKSETLSLSTLTLPHGLARIILAEQLYRAVSIIKNHPYHRR